MDEGGVKSESYRIRDELGAGGRFLIQNEPGKATRWRARADVLWGRRFRLPSAAKSRNPQNG